MSGRIVSLAFILAVAVLLAVPAAGQVIGTATLKNGEVATTGTYGAPASLTWLITQPAGSHNIRLGPVTLTCEPWQNSPQMPISTHQTSACAGAEFFLRFTEGLEDHIKLLVLRDETSQRFAIEGSSANVNWDTAEDSGRITTKLCGSWTTDDCFVNRAMTYTRSFKDLAGVADDTARPLAKIHTRATAPNSTARDPSLVGQAGVLLSSPPHGIKYHSRMAGSVYNVHLNARHFVVQLDGWTDDVAATFNGHAFVQLEVRLTGQNSLTFSLTAFAACAALVLLLGAVLYRLRVIGIRRYGLADHLTAITVWRVGGRAGEAVAAVTPQFVLPEIIGQPVTPARLAAAAVTSDAARGSCKISVNDASSGNTEQHKMSFRQRLYVRFGWPTAQAPFTRAPNIAPEDEHPAHRCEPASLGTEMRPAPIAVEHDEPRTPLAAVPSEGAALLPVAAEGQAVVTVDSSPQPPQADREDGGHDPTQTSAAAAVTDDSDELLCRICQDPSPRGDLFAPCKCSGTSKYVHKACLAQWRHSTGNPAHRTACAECKTAYTERPPHQRTFHEACCLPLVKQTKAAMLLTACILLGGFLVKFVAFLVTTDDGIMWLPDAYHVYLGCMLVTSELMVVGSLAHFMTGYPIAFARATLWTLGWVLPVLFGYVAQYFIWMTEIVVWRQEVSYGAGVVCMFVASQYFLPSLNEYAARAEMMYWLEREVEARRPAAPAPAAVSPHAEAAAEQATEANGTGTVDTPREDAEAPATEASSSAEAPIADADAPQEAPQQQESAAQEERPSAD